MATKSNPTDVIAAIELVCKELLNADTINKWYDVKDRPLTKIMAEIGLDKHYSSVIYDVLKEIGLIEKEGERANLRYKIKTSIIPDAQKVAQDIYKRYKAKSAEYSRASKPSDLQPFKPKKTKTMNDFEIESCRKTARKSKNQPDYSRIPHLGQIVYALVNGYITEARITCVRFDEIEKNKVRVDFTTAMPMTDSELDKLGDDEFAGELICKKNYCLRNIAFSVEELIKKLQQNIKKF